jgi:Zn-dependent protease with chaperone function
MDSAEDKKIPVSRQRTIAISIAGVLFGVVVAAGFLSWWNSTRIRIPECVLLEDIQRPLDRDIMAQLQAIDKTGASKLIDSAVLKPLVDDVQTIGFTMSAVEITDKQFSRRADLLTIINDCARILGIKRPRVFVTDLPGLNAFTTNLTDPIIVLHSSLLRRNISERELRFIIGHEMGHIKCAHVKWLMVMDIARKNLPESAATVSILPLLKWSREAEMTADNAGLVCCQDLKAAEQAMVRFVLNLDDQTIGTVNIDEYLRQRNNGDFSKFSEAVQLWRQLTQEHPFIPDRIKQLRSYAQSRPYQNLREN